MARMKSFCTNKVIWSHLLIPFWTPGDPSRIFSCKWVLVAANANVLPALPLFFNNLSFVFYCSKMVSRKSCLALFLLASYPYKISRMKGKIVWSISCLVRVKYFDFKEFIWNFLNYVLYKSSVVDPLHFDYIDPDHRIHFFSSFFSIKNIILKTMIFYVISRIYKTKSDLYLKIIWYSYNFGGFFMCYPDPFFTKPWNGTGSTTQIKKYILFDENISSFIINLKVLPRGNDPR